MTVAPISVQIPSHGRPQRLAALLERILTDPVRPGEVLVGLDGGSDEEASRVRDSWAGTGETEVVVMGLPGTGVSGVRAALLERARQPVSLMLNDDVLPAPGFIAAHAHRHATSDSGGPALVTGPAPFAEVEEPTLFDMLVTGTGLIFFDAARAASDGTIGFRHCWTLNLSIPTDAARAVGGVTVTSCPYGYEDIELAHRLTERLGARVCWEPSASVVHHHRYTPDDVIRREYRLGLAAAEFADRAPEFSARVFGRDLRRSEVRDDARGFVSIADRDADRLADRFRSLATVPTEPGISQPALDALADGWVLLKRWLWWNGVLDRFLERPDGASVERVMSFD